MNRYTLSIHWRYWKLQLPLQNRDPVPGSRIWHPSYYRNVGIHGHHAGLVWVMTKMSSQCASDQRRSPSLLPVLREKHRRDFIDQWISIPRRKCCGSNGTLSASVSSFSLRASLGITSRYSFALYITQNHFKLVVWFGVPFCRRRRLLMRLSDLGAHSKW